MNIKNSKQKNIGTRAFTLIEALVAVSILMIAIAGPMTLAQKSLMSATLSKDQMIAGFLAQDGIEAVKNIRDQIARNTSSGPGVNWLTGTAPDGFLSPCICSSPSTVHPDLCKFDSKYPFSCYINTTSPSWNNSITSDRPVNGSQIQVSPTDKNKLQISFDSITNNFLKYDYVGSQLSRFSRYININQISDNEAIINVRVFWDSPSGVQKVDAQDFIYNYSGNQ
jgi:type II secretory pathway pseudopilin PulG